MFSQDKSLNLRHFPRKQYRRCPLETGVSLVHSCQEKATPKAHSTCQPVMALRASAIAVDPLGHSQALRAVCDFASSGNCFASLTAARSFARASLGSCFVSRHKSLNVITPSLVFLALNLGLTVGFFVMRNPPFMGILYRTATGESFHICANQGNDFQKHFLRPAAKRARPESVLTF
jgi:hypothetical protein